MSGTGTGTPVIVGASGGYCTQADIVQLVPAAQLAELTAESGGTPDATVVAEAIAAADAEINSYIGVRYLLPLPEVPAQVKAVSADLAIYWLYKRRSLITEARRQAWVDRIAFLKDVSTGRAHLQGIGTPEEPGAAETVTKITSQRRIFDRKTLRDL